MNSKMFTDPLGTQLWVLLTVPRIGLIWNPCQQCRGYVKYELDFEFRISFPVLQVEFLNGEKWGKRSISPKDLLGRNRNH